MKGEVLNFGEKRSRGFSTWGKSLAY